MLQLLNCQGEADFPRLPLPEQRRLPYALPPLRHTLFKCPLDVPFRLVLPLRVGTEALPRLLTPLQLVLLGERPHRPQCQQPCHWPVVGVAKPDLLAGMRPGRRSLAHNAAHPVDSAAQDEAVRSLPARSHGRQRAACLRVRPQPIRRGDNGDAAAEVVIIVDELCQVDIIEDATGHTAPRPAARRFAVLRERRHALQRCLPEARLVQQSWQQLGPGFQGRGGLRAEQLANIEERMVPTDIRMPLRQAPQLHNGVLRVCVQHCGWRPALRSRLNTSLHQTAACKDGC
mmetsp:Transcript_1574/g.3250  ORF Transcript_1574/g.3250 Transcript_1574/m.3250 type:complete len:287 (+) Transcript_1574:149-1009(+)